MRWKESGGKDVREMWQENPTTPASQQPKIEEVVDHEEVVISAPENTHKPPAHTSEKKPVVENKDDEKVEKTNTKTESKCSTAAATTDETGDCFNGGKTDKYSWSQTISDVDLKIPLPDFVKKSKDLKIEIQSNSVSVALATTPPADSGMETGQVLLAGKLKEKVKCEDSLWSLTPGMKYKTIQGDPKLCLPLPGRNGTGSSKTDHITF